MKVFQIETLLRPHEIDLNDLGLLDSVFSGSRIVGVGEGAHFVSEFSLVRASLIRYLVERHFFNTIALECGAIQAARLTEWINSPDQECDFQRFAGPLTGGLYGTLLNWLKYYIKSSGHQLRLVGIDLPNTLSPKEDLVQLQETIQQVDPFAVARVDELVRLLDPIEGQSAVMSASTWGGLTSGERDKATAIICGLRLRLESLAPVIRERCSRSQLQKVSELLLAVEYTLEALRGIKALFDGESIEGETSVRDRYMANSVEKLMNASPDMKMIILAHNNHIQRTHVSFSGELTAVPMGQHLSDMEYYRAIALTHIGPTVPEMHFPSAASPVGFSVESAPAADLRADSIEQHIGIIEGAKKSSLAVLLPSNTVPKSIRSQSALMEIDVNRAFDAVLCTPQATKDDQVCF